MRLEQLQYIVEVAKQKSISKAAENLYISQPSLSKAVSLFEEELATSIFVRHHQGVSLTTTGELVVIKAKNILHEIEGIETLCKNAQTENVPTLSVAFPLLLCNDTFMGIVTSLQDEAPQLSIITYQQNTAETIEDVRTGKLDLGIISYCSPEKDTVRDLCAENNLVKQRLSQECFYLLASKTSPVGNRESIDFRELESLKKVTFSDMFDNNGYSKPEKNLSYAPNIDVIDSMLLSNEYVSILPRIGAITSKYVQSGQLVAIPIENCPLTQYISMVFTSEHVFTPHAQKFIELFANTYKEYTRT